MAWYIMRTAASMPVYARASYSRHWFGPFPTREAAQCAYDSLFEDGVGMTDMVVEEETLLVRGSYKAEPEP